MVQITPTVSEIVTTNIAAENFGKGHDILSIDIKAEKKPKNSAFCHKLGYFLTMRMMIAVLMSACLMALSVTATNLAGSLVCMVVKEDENFSNSRIIR
uniref:Col_cuticle_N domain-containing protein n=1 Tax=Elaeophora elaphi TaxID=1147741 RepID=A0A0R3RNF0_9BILA